MDGHAGGRGGLHAGIGILEYKALSRRCAIDSGANLRKGQEIRHGIRLEPFHVVPADDETQQARHALPLQHGHDVGNRAGRDDAHREAHGAPPDPVQDRWLNRKFVERSAAVGAMLAAAPLFETLRRGLQTGAPEEELAGTRVADADQTFLVFGPADRDAPRLGRR